MEELILDGSVIKSLHTKISQAYPKSWKTPNNLSMKEKYDFNINLQLNLQC